MKRTAVAVLLMAVACTKQDPIPLHKYRNTILTAELGQSLESFEAANASATLSPFAPPMTYGVGYMDLAGLSIAAESGQTPLAFPSIRLLGSARPQFNLEHRDDPKAPLKGTLHAVHYRPAYSNNNVADTLAAIAGFLITVRAQQACAMIEEDKSSLGTIEQLNVSAPPTIRRFEEGALRIRAVYKCANLEAELFVIDGEKGKGFDVTYSFALANRPRTTAPVPTKATEAEARAAKEQLRKLLDAPQPEK